LFHVYLFISYLKNEFKEGVFLFKKKRLSKKRRACNERSINDFCFCSFFAGNVYSQPVPNQKEDGTQNTRQAVGTMYEEEELPAPAPPQRIETEMAGRWNFIWGLCSLLPSLTL
jgi:hypothetical protein